MKMKIGPFQTIDDASFEIQIRK